MTVLFFFFWLVLAVVVSFTIGRYLKRTFSCLPKCQSTRVPECPSAVDHFRIVYLMQILLKTHTHTHRQRWLKRSAQCTDTIFMFTLTVLLMDLSPHEINMNLFPFKIWKALFCGSTEYGLVAFVRWNVDAYEKHTNTHLLIIAPFGRRRRATAAAAAAAGALSWVRRIFVLKN